jgi:hypothetical protein
LIYLVQITVAAALFAILDPDSVDPSEVGLIITYALNVTQVTSVVVVVVVAKLHIFMNLSTTHSSALY